MSDGFTQFKKGILLDPQSADPSNPVEGDLHYSDGTARSEGVWQYRNASWHKVASDATTSTGDMVYNDGTSLNRLAIGSSGDTLQVSGGVPTWAAAPEALDTVSTKTTTYTILSTDNTILADATSAAFTLTLPAAASNSGKIFKIKKIDTSSNIVTVDGNASETIDGVASVKVIGQYATLAIVSDGTNWRILEKTQNIRVEARGNSSDVISASTEDVPFSSVIVDTSGSYDNSGNTDANTADAFTCPETGEYLVTGGVRANANSSAEIAVYIDGGIRYNIGYMGGRVNNIFSGVIRLDEGEVMTLRVDIGMTLVNSTLDHNIRIIKLNTGY